MRVSTITRRDVLELHREISRKYPIGANRVLALVSKMFSLAVLWELRSDNPATKIPKNPENRREVFLSSTDLAALGKTLREAEVTQSESIYAVAAIRLLLFTGCRRNEILGLRWSEVDFEHGVLHLSDSKTGGRIVQLNPPALKILARLSDHERRDSESPLVIQGRCGGTRQLAIQPPWQRIRESAGLDGVRLHDLRHTHASVAAQRGESLIVIGSLLGHRAPATTARYAHLSDDPRRAASERTAADISAALDADFGEVAPAIPLRR
jgi:integrase